MPTAHGPTGSFGPDKHDSGNYVYVSQYHASTGKFTPVGGGRPQAGQGAVTVSAQGEPVVDVQGIDVSYGRVQVLFDVSLSVGRGETVALVGTNGAGKSTLLKAISGLAAVERGSIHVLGRDVTERGRSSGG